MSDLGLSKNEDYYNGSKESNSALPIRWCAPEVLTRRKFSSKVNKINNKNLFSYLFLVRCMVFWYMYQLFID